MNKKSLLKLLFLFLCTVSLNSHAQLTVSGAMTPQQLVQNVLLGTGVTVSNITYTGAAVAKGSFNGTASNIGLASGVLLTTGDISVAPGPNDAGGDGLDNNLPGDPLLATLSGDTTLDAAILEFDFLPLADTIRFRYVFGSEEYDEYVCASVNDVFGFFISGPGIIGQQNMALIPGTSTPVSINTLNNGSVGSNGSMGPGCILSNAGYFVSNGDGTTPGLNPTIQYDGFTTVLTAQAVVVPCLTYHLRIAIADGGDHVFDSGVFLEAGSFISGSPVVAVAQATSGVLGCAPFTATFNNTSTGTNHFFWDFGDASPFDTTTNPAHIYQQGGVYTVHLIADDTTACNFSDTLDFTIVIDSGLVYPSFNLTSTGYCDSIHVDVTSTSRGVHLYDWNFGDGGIASGTSAAHTFNSPGTYDIYHIVTDTICHISDSVSQRVVLEPKLHSLISASNEEGCVPFGLNICYPGVTTGATQIQWDFGNGITSRTLCDSAHYDQPGIYNARLIVTDTTFCNFRDTSFITIHAKVSPQASFNLPDSQNVLYPVIFDNVSSNGVSYSWDFDDQHYSFFENPDHQYTQPGIYTICMTATNDNCIDTACRELKVYENPQAIWFPKAFSPNGDGKNDVFFADGIGITSMQMIIYNRWGLKLFETNTPGNGWDGSYKGSLVESGVYVVYFNAILLNGENEEQYSTVTVYR